MVLAAHAGRSSVCRLGISWAVVTRCAQEACEAPWVQYKREVEGVVEGRLVC